ncbi:MAG: aminopeptidase P family protein [Sedimentisphaerales bacterium]|nr:aminopeptidase P family protein [Sedimentisphaerales bacterium]
MNKEIIKKRIRAIRGELSNRGIDCLIVTRPANVTYTTGFLGDDSWAVITRNKVYFLTDSRYTEQARSECEDCTIIERADLMPKAAGKLIEKLKSMKSVSVEGTVSLAVFKALKKHVKVRIKSAEGIIETVRSVKDITEIKTIEFAASISYEALKKTLRYIKPGITESELAGMLDFQIRKLGATNSFETIVAFGANGSRPHHQPGKRKLKQRDTVLIDFGARYKGYCSDITRCFVIGGERAFYKKVYDVVEQAQAAAIKIIKAGVKMKDVDSAARAVIQNNGLPVYGHGSGHGVGLEIHELPFLKVESKGILEAGQVITIEPGIYMPGRLGVRIEDDVLVTKDGCKILTRKCPHAPLLP